MQMNKTDLIKMVAEKANKPTKEVAEIIDSFFQRIISKSKRKRCFYKRFWYFQKDYSASSDS